MSGQYPLAPRSTAISGLSSGLLGLIEKLRRYKVGLVQVEIGALPEALLDLQSQLPDAVLTDLLQNLNEGDIERLTARRLAELVVPSAIERVPRIVLNFESLFTTLERSSQQQVIKHLAWAEPLRPCLVILHSDYTTDRLREAFSNRIYQWNRASR
ncbi:MAG: hypothetical protein D6711_09975 [Chloroflexi bacterium]|nr:MAG: hypothetical protein D6711_09975 [Chloroflexota bacterium]